MNLQGQLNQKQVWDSIAIKWKEFKIKPTKEVISFMKTKKGKILDLGCGSGRNFIKTKGKIYGVDFSKELLKYAKEKNIAVELKKASVMKIPYPNNFFDAAIFIAVLHCIDSKEKREKSLKELYRVIKKGAKAMIIVWSRKQKRLKNKPKESMIPWTVNGKKYYRYNYIYSKKELRGLLEKTGFKIIKIWENNNIIAIIKK